jgi:RimJ/RimL family protein N-acetyltransferase
MLKCGDILLTVPIATDSPILFGWINDAETVRLNAPYAPVSEANHAAWFAGLNKTRDRVLFAVRTQAGGPPIGTVQLFDIHPVHRSAELAIRIGAEQDRGQGYGTSALLAVLDFAWRDLNLNRVWLKVFASNKRAIRAYTKAGFEIEGTMRRTAWIDGAWVDEIVMAALCPSAH